MNHFIRISLCCIAFLTAPIIMAHDQPLPGEDNASAKGQQNNNRPEDFPGQKFLHTGKGKLNGGSVGAASGGPFASFNIEFLSQLTLSQLGAGSGVRGNDIWGWTDSLDNREYALVGRTNATSFVDITDPINPIYLGYLPSHTGNTAWRDIKVYSNHAFIVADNNGAHGMQVFDLTQLRSVANPPAVFTETAHYAGIDEAHNVVINEETGYAYLVGTETYSGGMHFVDISNPAIPLTAGGFSGDGYTHDAQVVTYTGPDSTYTGREVAFNSNTDTLTIVDVTDKNTPVQLSRTGYTNSGYTHQGWLTEDHTYFLSNDELDERDNPAVNFTYTHIWNVADLDAPIYVGFYEASVQSIDHNLYIHDGLVYEANYTTGLRVLDASDIANGNLIEVAYIDTHPSKDSLTSFDGAWSSYPYFPSGNIIIGDRDEGLIVVRLQKSDLDIIGSSTPGPLTEGSQLIYTFDVSNNGPDDATNATFIDALPIGVSFVQATSTLGSCSEISGIVTCLLGTLADQVMATITITVTVDTAGSLINTATATADEIDRNISDNAASIVTTVLLASQDGDLAPLGAPDGVVNAADLLIAYRIVTGTLQPTALELLHGDVYPPGAPDGIINLSDLIIIRALIQ